MVWLARTCPETAVRVLVGTALGLMVGTVTAFLLLFPMIDLFTCGTFWEQGCGPHHNLMLFGSLAASGLGGVFAGWGAAALFNTLVARLQAAISRR